MDSMDKITTVHPDILALDLRERELKLAQDAQEFDERQDEKRRRLALDEEERRRRMDLDDRQLKLQEQQLAFMTAVMNRDKN